jgi:hypothetical protein
MFPFLDHHVVIIGFGHMPLAFLNKLRREIAIKPENLYMLNSAEKSLPEYLSQGWIKENYLATKDPAPYLKAGDVLIAFMGEDMLKAASTQSALALACPAHESKIEGKVTLIAIPSDNDIEAFFEAHPFPGDPKAKKTAYLVAATRYLISHPTQGFLKAEELPFEELIEPIKRCLSLTNTLG